MFAATEQFDPRVAQVLMRRPDIYWSAHDRLSPQPETIDFTAYLAHPDVWTVLGTYNDVPIGYVTFMKRTSVGAEIHVGFVPECRGRVAKTIVQHAIGLAFRDHGMLKLWAIIPSDNRRAILGAKAIGFAPEGRLRNAIMRDAQPPLRDLLILGLSR